MNTNVLIDKMNKEISQGNIQRDIIDTFGEQEKIESMQISEMIRGNLANLEGRDKPVFDALTSLQNTVNEISPHNFKPSFFEKLFGKTAMSMKKYFQKFCLQSVPASFQDRPVKSSVSAICVHNRLILRLIYPHDPSVTRFRRSKGDLRPHTAR